MQGKPNKGKIMITTGLEDYLELIYNSIEKKENIKAIDIANKFNISRSSVSEALIRLADLGLIIYNGRKGIDITTEGKVEAEKIIKKHRILYTFFNEILSINQTISNKNACKIEHVIDDEVIAKIEIFSNYCKANSIEKKFKETQND